MAYQQRANEALNFGPALQTILEAMASPQTPIPAFYRHFFTTIDPLVALSGVYGNFFTPQTVSEAYIPASIAAYNPANFILYRINGGDLLCVAFLMVVLLRYTKDVVIWKILEGAVLIIDLVILQGLWEMHGQQGRRFVGKGGMRWEDWACVGITLTVAVIRSAFLAGVGFERHAAGKKGV
jgi:hypothetical protein